MAESKGEGVGRFFFPLSPSFSSSLDGGEAIYETLIRSTAQRASSVAPFRRRGKHLRMSFKHSNLAEIGEETQKCVVVHNPPEQRLWIPGFSDNWKTTSVF